MSLSISLGQLAFSLGPGLLGWMRDAAGSWDAAIGTCIALQAIAVALALGTAPRARHRRRAGLAGPAFGARRRGEDS